MSGKALLRKDLTEVREWAMRLHGTKHVKRGNSHAKAGVEVLGELHIDGSVEGATLNQCPDLL